MKHWSERLPMNACADAVSWAREQPSYAAAWQSCERGDWMLWVAGRLAGSPESTSRRKLVLAACACARTALRFVPKNEERPRVAIKTAERWARRERGVSLSDVKNAYAAAYAAADAAYAAYAAAYAAADAAYAAYAAAYAAADAAYDAYAAYAAAYAAYAAAYAAADATDAAYAAARAATDAAYAAYAVAGAGARTEALKGCAAIVRRHYPTPPKLGRA